MSGLAALMVACQSTASALPQISAPKGYWAAQIFQKGCDSSGTFDENPHYTMTESDALPCTAITGYGYQSVNFDDSTNNWAINVYTDESCTVPLLENVQDNQCITSPVGQFVVAISVTSR